MLPEVLKGRIVLKENKLKQTGRVAALVFWIIVTVFPILGIVASIFWPLSFYTTQVDYRHFIHTYGQWAPVALIGLQILQVVITPLSHYAVGYMGGFLFGPYLGGIYNYIGRVIGHTIAFYISRHVASPFVRRFVPSGTIDTYNRAVSNRPDLLFLIYFLPLFPDDEMSYLAGLSKMRTKFFMIANILGQLGGSFSLAYMGSGINTKDTLFWVLSIVTLAGFPILWILSKRNPLAGIPIKNHDK